MELLEAFEGLPLDPVDFVLVEAQLDDVGRQIGRDLRQVVVGKIEQAQAVHILEGIRVDL